MAVRPPQMLPRYRWRADPGNAELGRNGEWCAGRRGGRHLGRHAAIPPASNAKVTIVCRRLCGVMCLASPARRARRATIRAASWRSSRPPVFDTSSGPSVRPPSAASIARTVRGANGTSVCWSPLPTTARTRWARSIRRSATSAVHASDTRNPFKMSRQERAWSRAEAPSAAARNRTVSSRSSPSVCESRATEGRRTWATGSGEARPLGPRSGRSQPRWPGAGPRWRGSGRHAQAGGHKPRHTRDSQQPNASVHTPGIEVT